MALIVAEIETISPEFDDATGLPVNEKPNGRERENDTSVPSGISSELVSLSVIVSNILLKYVAPSQDSKITFEPLEPTICWASI